MHMGECFMFIHSDGANQTIHKKFMRVLNLELVLQLRSKLFFLQSLLKEKRRKHNVSRILKMPTEDPCSRISLRNKGQDLSSGNIESRTCGRNRLGLVPCKIFMCPECPLEKKSRKTSCIGIHLCSKWSSQLIIFHKGYLFQSMKVSPKPHCFAI